MLQCKTNGRVAGRRRRNPNARSVFQIVSVERNIRVVIPAKAGI
jgi:hypothetical protein